MSTLPKDKDGSGVNFINVKRSKFSYETSFRQLFSSDMYVKKRCSYEKFVRLMLMKLTPGLHTHERTYKLYVFIQIIRDTFLKRIDIFFCLSYLVFKVIEIKKSCSIARLGFESWILTCSFHISKHTSLNTK